MDLGEKMRVLVIREGEMLVAQCLEYDICTSAGDLNTLRDRFCGLAECYRLESLSREGEEFKGLAPAPVEFHQMWDEAMKFEDGHRPFEMAMAA